MALDLATTSDGGVSNLAVGSFTGDGTVTDCNCGFMPRYVKLINLTDRTTYELTNDMTAGHALQTVAAGTMTHNTTAGILLMDGSKAFRGFQVPAAIAISAKSMHYIAFG